MKGAFFLEQPFGWYQGGQPLNTNCELHKHDTLPIQLWPYVFHVVHFKSVVVLVSSRNLQHTNGSLKDEP